MNEFKIQLLDNLQYDTYCRIGISKIHGIGVIAIKNIPKGVNPFAITGNKCLQYNCIEISEKDIQKLSPPIKKMVSDFLASHKRNFCVPYNGFNSIDISFYMNHSINNNINLIRIPQCQFMQFRTNRNINAGEELVINYNHFNINN